MQFFVHRRKLGVQFPDFFFQALGFLGKIDDTLQENKNRSIAYNCRCGRFWPFTGILNFQRVQPGQVDDQIRVGFHDFAGFFIFRLDQHLQRQGRRNIHLTAHVADTCDYIH